MMQIEAKQITASDEELMARFQNGDTDAMQDLFARYQKPLFNFFYKMVGRREMSEDLVQETFLKLCRFGNSFRGSEAKFSTWLYSIAGNQCRDYIRHSARRPEAFVEDLEQNVSDDDETGSLYTASGSPVEDQIIQMEVQATIKRAIKSLPEKERTAIILREYQGLEYKEIAEALGCPIGSVKVLIFRARQRLRERLDGLSA